MAVLPSLVILSVECTNVVINILFKAASLKGLSYNNFVTYSFVLATFVFIPLFFFRNTVFPPLKFPLVSRLCLLGLIGCLSKACLYKGVQLSSPTISSALANLVPAFIFILAVFFRMEKVEFRRSATQAIIIGTITSMSGALVMTFYKGPKIISSSPSVLQLQRPFESSQSNWIIGGILEAVAYLLVSFWCIIQIVVSLFYNLCAALISLPISLIAEPQLSSWSLTSSVSVAAVLYTWCIRVKEPVFVASFTPTSIVVASVMSFIFLGEAIYLGSVIGAVIITGGLYAVLWGKAKEAEEMRDEEPCGLSPLGSSSSGRVPLLQSIIGH